MALLPLSPSFWALCVALCVSTPSPLAILLTLASGTLGVVATLVLWNAIRGRQSRAVGLLAVTWVGALPLGWFSGLLLEGPRFRYVDRASYQRAVDELLESGALEPEPQTALTLGTPHPGLACAMRGDDGTTIVDFVVSGAAVGHIGYSYVSPPRNPTQLPACFGWRHCRALGGSWYRCGD